MSDLIELLDTIHKYNERMKITEDSSEAEKLRNRLMNLCNTPKDECLKLQNEISEFMQSDASEEDKKMVSGYTESLLMICNAINEGLL